MRTRSVVAQQRRRKMRCVSKNGSSFCAGKIAPQRDPQNGARSAASNNSTKGRIARYTFYFSPPTNYTFLCTVCCFLAHLLHLANGGYNQVFFCCMSLRDRHILNSVLLASITHNSLNQAPEMRWKTFAGPCLATCGSRYISCTSYRSKETRFWHNLQKLGYSITLTFFTACFRPIVQFHYHVLIHLPQVRFWGS